MTNNQNTSSLQAPENSLILMSKQADQINQFHDLARSKLVEAADYVKKAGELLLDVKRTLKHGQFQRWVEENCSCGVRQAQRYMSVALNKSVPIQDLTLKNDTMSYLPPPNKSNGIWVDGKWRPERGCIYLFKEHGSTYWILPSTDEIPHFHVCKHYAGAPMPTDNFYWRYTVVGNTHDPDLTSEFYVGTRFPLFGASGVADVLKSYGLKDIRKSLVFGKKTADRFDRPFGEPDTEIQYWSDDIFAEPDLGVPPSKNPQSEPHPTGTPAFGPSVIEQV